MNNRLSILACAALAALVLPLSLQAYTATVNGIEWTYTVTDGKASLGHQYDNPWGDCIIVTAVSTSTSSVFPGSYQKLRRVHRHHGGVRYPLSADSRSMDIGYGKIFT